MRPPGGTKNGQARLLICLQLAWLKAFRYQVVVKLRVARD